MIIYIRWARYHHGYMYMYICACGNMWYCEKAINEFGRVQITLSSPSVYNIRVCRSPIIEISNVLDPLYIIYFLFYLSCREMSFYFDLELTLINFSACVFIWLNKFSRFCVEKSLFYERFVDKLFVWFEWWATDGRWINTEQLSMRHLQCMVVMMMMVFFMMIRLELMKSGEFFFLFLVARGKIELTKEIIFFFWKFIYWNVLEKGWFISMIFHINLTGLILEFRFILLFFDRLFWLRINWQFSVC